MEYLISTRVDVAGRWSGARRAPAVQVFDCRKARKLVETRAALSNSAQEVRLPDHHGLAVVAAADPAYAWRMCAQAMRNVTSPSTARIMHHVLVNARQHVPHSRRNTKVLKGCVIMVPSVAIHVTAG